jgi:hypothetical protein
LIDIGRLTVKEDLYLYILRMEALFACKVRVSVVTDLFEGIKCDMFILFGAKLNRRSNFPSDNDMFPCNEHFARYTAFWITDDKTIDDAVGNDIGTFIGMSRGDDFGGK